MIDFLRAPAEWTGWIIFAILWICIVYGSFWFICGVLRVRKAFLGMPKDKWEGNAKKWNFLKLYVIIFLNGMGKMLIIDKEGDAYELNFKSGRARKIDASSYNGHDV